MTYLTLYRPPFGTWGRLNLDIAIDFYTITPFFPILLSDLLYRYIHGQGICGGAVPIILRRLLSEIAGSTWAPSLLNYAFPVQGVNHNCRFYRRGYGAIFKGFNHRGPDGGQVQNNAYLLHPPYPLWQQPRPHYAASDAAPSALPPRAKPRNLKYL